MEAYICIGKCVPTPASHSRVRPLSPSSDRTSFTRRVRPPPLPALSCVPSPAPQPPRSAPVLRSSRSHSQRSLAVLSIPAISVPPASSFIRAVPLAPLACLRARRAFFYSLFISPRSSFFSPPQHAPGRRVIFIICYLLRHTPPAVVVCPARPTRKNRKIEENKSGRRGAPRIPRGGALGQRVAASGVSGRGGGGGRTG